METELTLEEIPFDDMGGGLDPRATQFTASVSQQEEMMRVAAYLELLKKLGYYKGKIDGIWGRLTENAYEQYSRDSKGDGHQTVVKSGDTLSKIANKYGVSVLLIAAINPLITNINRILVGLVINLPYFIKTRTSNSKSSSKSNTSGSLPTNDVSLPKVVETPRQKLDYSNYRKSNESMRRELNLRGVRVPINQEPLTLQEQLYYDLIMKPAATTKSPNNSRPAPQLIHTSNVQKTSPDLLRMGRFNRALLRAGEALNNQIMFLR